MIKFKILSLLLSCILCFYLSLSSYIELPMCQNLGAHYIENPMKLMQGLSAKVKSLGQGVGTKLNKLKSPLQNDSKLQADLVESLKQLGSNEKFFYEFLNAHKADFLRIFCDGVANQSDFMLLRTANTLRSVSYDTFDQQLTKIAKENMLDQEAFKKQFESLLDGQENLTGQKYHIGVGELWFYTKKFCLATKTFLCKNFGGLVSLWNTAYAQNPTATIIATCATGLCGLYLLLKVVGFFTQRRNRSQVVVTNVL